MRSGCDRRLQEDCRDFSEVSVFVLALTECLRKAGDDNWRSYARRAIQIFEKTTTIAGHNGNHDQALANLLRMNP